MLYGEVVGAPKLNGRFYIKHSLTDTFNLVHPVPGVATWYVTDARIGAVIGAVFTPASNFYGLGHIVGICGGVRCLISIQLVPDNVPKYTNDIPHYRLYKRTSDIQKGNWLTPRAGALNWEQASNPFGFDDTLWMTPVKRTVVCTYHLGTGDLDGTMNGGVAITDSLRWYCLRRLPGYAQPSFVEEQNATQTIGLGGGPSATFNVPGLTLTSHVLMATDGWDCWMLPLETA